MEKSDWHVLCATIDIHKRSSYHMNMEGGISVIIDSHAHYNNNAYKKPFRYLLQRCDPAEASPPCPEHLADSPCSHQKDCGAERYLSR